MNGKLWLHYARISISLTDFRLKCHWPHFFFFFFFFSFFIIYFFFKDFYLKCHCSLFFFFFFFFPLIKSISFPDYFSEKIISIDKIPAFLQAFEHVISTFTTAQSGICVSRAISDVTSGTALTFDWVFRMLSKHFWVICDSYFIKTGQEFYVKELYHLALQFRV